MADNRSYANMKKLRRMRSAATAVLVFALLMTSGCASSALANKPPVSAGVDFFAMNTYMTITCYGPDAKAAADAGEAAVYELEKTESRMISTSEISRINANSGKGPVTVSQETFDIISDAVQYAEKTQGAFDITIAPVMDIWGFGDGNYKVPTDVQIQAALPLVNWKEIKLDAANLTVELPVAGMQLDLGGIGKGFASDKVQKIIKGYNVTAALINLGGNVAVFGPKTDGSLWKIGIADPNAPDPNAADAFLGVLTGTDISVITSGGYERFFVQGGKTYIHIMDPATGKPAESDLLSVSIVTPNGMQGDCLSTALFVMGKDKAMTYWRDHKDFSCILVTTSGEVFASQDLKDKFALVDTKTAYTLQFFS